MKNSVSSLLDLRILILALGEAHHAAWYKSQFLSPIGLSFLERIYPRSTFAAAVRSVGRAARAVHDASIGTGAVFHLFRLPRQTEREIDAVLDERSTELVDRYRPLLADRASLMHALQEMAGASTTASDPPLVGPVRLSAGRAEQVSTMAAAYCGAFQQDTQVFPYFDR